MDVFVNKESNVFAVHHKFHPSHYLTPLSSFPSRKPVPREVLAGSRSPVALSTELL